MATNQHEPDENQGETLDRMTANLARVETLSQRLVAALSKRTPANPTLNAPSQDLFAKAAASYWTEAMENPTRIYQNQLEYWGQSVRQFMQAQQMMLTGDTAAGEAEPPRDKRFSNPLWTTHPYFRYIREQYELNAKAVADAVAEVDDLDPVEKKRLDYFSRQIVDMMAPTNFLGTNPDALEKAVETEGESLVRGLENLVADLEANDGEMVVRLADETAFELGGNIATTPGKVVFRNEMMELIQYAPATQKVREIPLIIFPPWINKFYILDLKAQNSLIKWITEQGYTLFVVSWVNPDASHADIGMEQYVEDGYLAAIREVKAITGQKRVNAVGYCIAGTTLALTLSLMKARGDASINSATFFTALTDFDNQGEFTPFLQDDFVDGIEAEVEAQGILRSFILGRTMSFLRSNDLIYRPAIRSYMMGETPPAFDLLYWNGDGANLPGRMTRQYLRELCQKNAFAAKGFDLLGKTLRLSDIDVPLMAVTCETDHIAPWKDCYRGMQKTSSKDRTFIVSQSGHIAGIVNPPSKKKYGHYTNGDWSGDAATWKDAATFTEGSWWPRWEAWLRPRSGEEVPTREPGDSAHPPLADAPGDYVRKRATR
ncbi:class I poly(R)-hydroxyalkanoic acid synthase [Pelagivirga sediminicola]|uniref:Class I poly(R)-hydroxyalkanoic acid synthase n=1 Tax=Pelagivirga sediminicola TaxID=2170575 RepID=A0A2T7GA35_9RHOB|nr:class I poly(R)-hydroxyalkanoic acid synthase [Pelagivirga sediminicola]PVA11287.1 class I poly(R)-hydroxyalkanoic acid synthase [Pelagivirga sediminicola]